MRSRVVETEHLADFIQESWLLTSDRVRHIRSPLWHPRITEDGHGAKLPAIPPNSALSGQHGTCVNGALGREGNHDPRFAVCYGGCALRIGVILRCSAVSA